jgi:chromosome partitioning protein
MSIYSIVNGAGSAGKTTTAVALATLLASRGATVRLIDCDPQGTASHCTGYPVSVLADGQPTVAEVLAETATLKDVEVPARVPVEIDSDGMPIFDEDSVIPNLTVVPALRQTLDEFVPRLPVIRRGVVRLRRAIAEADDVDVTILDTPGNSNALTTSAMLATAAFEDSANSGVITCTFPGPKEVEGINVLRNELVSINDEYNTDIELRGIVICKAVTSASQGRLYVEYADDVKSAFGDLVGPVIRDGVSVPEAYSFYTPVPLFSRAKSITQDYSDVLDHFIKIGLFPEAAGL